jgi:hypothetical protein
MDAPPAPQDPGSRNGSHRPRGALARTRLRYRVAVGLLVLVAGARIITLALHSSPHASAGSGQAGASRQGRLPTCGASCDPIDRRYLTDVRFGSASFWLQPWRAYLDTWPASRLLDSLGINFNVKDSQALPVARLLHDSGFTLARLEIDWGALSYANPTSFIHETNIRTKLRALHLFHLRPLIVLNANSGDPAPSKGIVLSTAAPAPQGATTVVLSPASATEAVPGRSGFNPGAFRTIPRKRRHRRRATGNGPRLTPAQRLARRAARRAARAAAARAGFTELVLLGKPAILITRIGPGNVATLSRPLPSALAAGPHRGTALLYAPFSAPTLPDGSPNPAFQATLRGWLGYVAAVSREAESICGPGGYDLEIWNELGFGSQFLNVANYEPRPPDREARRSVKAITRAVVKALLDATVAYVRDPAHGISPQVGITDGFASQSPFSGGAFAPRGLTALSKHPYVGPRIFPSEYPARSARPVNALGEPDTTSRRGNRPLFIPHYQSLFPEYTLTATSTETLIRDLAPFPTRIAGAPHGRYVARAGQTPLQKWVTEYNLGTSATPTGPDQVTPLSSVTLSAADRAHFHAKALLRSLVAMVSKGIGREYFFAAGRGPLSLLGDGFFAALEAHPHTYPGDQLGGEVLRGFRNMLGRLQGPGPVAVPVQLKLLSIAQQGDHAQFIGDGTAAHASLYDREVLGVFPYQTSPTRFVIPVYVMTRNLLTLYQPAAPSSDMSRFDLPAETFKITLANLPESGTPPIVSAYDPLSERATPARLLSRNGTTASVEIAATDYPRLLSVEYRGPS